MRIALCQCNPVMGDLAGNLEKLRRIVRSTAPESPELLVFPELFLQGYPPRDLLENAWFISDGMRSLEQLREISRTRPETAILVGAAFAASGTARKRPTNAAVVVRDGEVIFRQDKSLLPSYDVFDETRYFAPARDVDVWEYGGERIGITICEDIWCSSDLVPEGLYERDPMKQLAEKGVSLLINIAASPFHVDKQRQRVSLMRDHAIGCAAPFVFVNQVGGNDELVFDGASLVIDAKGGIRRRLPSFEESVRIVDTSASAGAGPEIDEGNEADPVASVYDALTLGVRDYVGKCGFHGAIVGLSGGIDSALTCAVAVDALGARNVMGVTMPSRYSSEGSVGDSERLARNLGIELKHVPIESAFAALLQTMQPHFEGREEDITEENLQARIRGTILMALSNKFGSLLLATGNKSEMAVGYCTLYGDMNGGLSVISDIPKTRVYELSRHVNRSGEVIPESILTKAPSAELRPGQKDRDSLPPYEMLDQVLGLMLEDGASRDEVCARGFDEKTVDWIAAAVFRSEYKRRQAAPGIKVTPKAFGSGRRFPIAARYRY